MVGRSWTPETGLHSVVVKHASGLGKLFLCHTQLSSPHRLLQLPLLLLLLYDSASCSVAMLSNMSVSLLCVCQCVCFESFCVGWCAPLQYRNTLVSCGAASDILAQSHKWHRCLSARTV